MKPQKNPTTPMIAAIGAGLLVGLLFLSYVFSSGLLHRGDTGILLQSGTDTAPAVDADSQLLTAQSVADVTVGTDNARQIIASLERPEAYSCTIENTLYYNGGSSTLRCRRYARDGVVRTDVLGSTGALQSTMLRDGDTIYAWDAGDTSAYQGQWGDFTDDAAAMLPTYEDVLDESITLMSAGRRDIDYEPCIMVEFEQGGYRCVYFVSAATGLLKEASFYAGETLARHVAVSSMKTEAPDKSLFSLPDGKNLLGEDSDDHG